MELEKHFTIRKPYNAFLSGIVDHYFFIDAPVSLLSEQAEFIIPFPRVTFGYLFDHPFTITNDTLKTSELINIAISRVSLEKVTVQPSTDRVKILGAHLKPFGLAYFTEKPLHSLSWLIHTEELFGNIATKFFFYFHA